MSLKQFIAEVAAKASGPMQSVAQFDMGKSGLWESSSLSQEATGTDGGAAQMTKADLPRLHRIVKEGSADVLKESLVSTEAVDELDQDGWTALHLAASLGRDDLVEMLLDAGANVNSTTPQKSTPLHLAASRGHKRAVEVLIRRKADVEMTMDGEWTALQRAATAGTPTWRVIRNVHLPRGRAGHNMAAFRVCTGHLGA